VVLHELGHFWTARAFGIKVKEFGLGYPPRILSFKRNNTVYSLNLLPLGGFVKLLGEDDDTDPESFASKGILPRAIVVSAGALTNLLLPIIAFSVLFMIPTEKIAGQVTIMQVEPNTPASEAGLIPGDIVQYVDGREIRNTSDLGMIVRLRMGSITEWEILRESRATLIPPSPDPTRRITPPAINSEIKTFNLTPRYDFPDGQGPTGIIISLSNAKRIKTSNSVTESIPMGIQRTVDILVLTKNEVTRWFVSAKKPTLGEDLTGPIGIARLTGEVAKSGLVPLVELAAFLSISLAILNILPIPALDGGRLLFIGIEWIRRGKKISPQKEGLIHMTGFIMLIILILVVSFFDIAKIVQGDSILR
jgi:regulator of sigma E protease